ncbi:MAG: glycosyl hydrolase family 28-related protein [Candidatus Andersenbacteria bacterium]
MRFNQKQILLGVAGIFGAIALIVLFMLFAPYLGIRAYIASGFMLTGPDVLIAGASNTITWLTSASGEQKYPFEKIELCKGEAFADRCITLADSVPSSKDATILVAKNIPTGHMYLRVTGRDPAQNLIITASSARDILVVPSVAISKNQTIAVRWVADAQYKTAKIEYCTTIKNEPSCYPIAQKANNTGSLGFVAVPKNIPASVGYIKVSSRGFGGLLVFGKTTFGSATLKSITVSQSSSSDSDSSSGGGGGGGGGSGSDGSDGGGDGDGGNSGDDPTPTPLIDGTVLCQGTNIKDFGAKGDGKADDTKAIQSAVTSAGNTKSTVCFPAGRYILSGEISFNSYGSVRSDAGALLEQTCSTCKIFAFTNQYVINIQGIKFLGGTKQIAVASSGAQDSSIQITDSEFDGSSDYAIIAGNISGDLLSGSLTIDRSKIVKTRKILRNSVTSAIVRDTWVTITKQNFDANSAAFWNAPGASLVFDNMMGTPAMGAGSDHLANTRWVDNYGVFKAVQSRFGGEDAGIPVVYQFNGSSRDSTSVSIQDSQVSAGGGTLSDSAPIVLKDEIPRTIIFSGNYFPIGVPLIRSIGIDVAQYIASHNPSLNIRINANVMYPIIPDIPVVLEPFAHRQVITLP